MLRWMYGPTLPPHWFALGRNWGSAYTLENQRNMLKMVWVEIENRQHQLIEGEDLKRLGEKLSKRYVILIYKWESEQMSWPNLLARMILVVNFALWDEDFVVYILINWSNPSHLLLLISWRFWTAQPCNPKASYPFINQKCHLWFFNILKKKKNCFTKTDAFYLNLISKKGTRDSGVSC